MPRTTDDDFVVDDDYSSEGLDGASDPESEFEDGGTRAGPRRGKGKGKLIPGQDKGKRRARDGPGKRRDGQEGYTWEEEYQRSWDVVREDESGSLEGAVNDFLQANKRRRLLRDTTSIQRGIIRHLFLVIDLSLSMSDRDLRPSRLELTLQYAQEFVSEFFDQNPISQMAIVGTRDGVAERLSPLSGNAVDHLKVLQNKRKLEASGEPSLQNALEMARAGLAHLPTHGSREVLVVFGSLTTCDPGNIHTTLDALEKDRVRVNVVGLSAEMSILRELCNRTKGKFAVVMNEDHFKDILFDCVPPPAVHKSLTGTGTGAGTSSSNSDLMLMGFPTMTSTELPSLCSCHGNRLRERGFICPRCGSKLCDVPTDCGICGLMVVSSPHLARSYRHLFPVGNWLEVDGPMPDPSSLPPNCFGCNLPFPTHVQSSSNAAPPTTATAANPVATRNLPPSQSQQQVARVSPTGRYMCPKCKNHFCLDCDVFVHDGLGICPGCH